MNNISQLLNESNEYLVIQEQTKKLTDKWTPWGLLEGLESGIEKGNMAMILENQLKRIIAEQSSTGTGGTFSAGQGEQWAGIALPMVRKVFAQIAAKDFVSVQPMNLPSGLVFYLDFKYGTTKDKYTSGDNVYGNLSYGADKMGVDEEVSGGLYGVGRFGYTINSASAAYAGGTLATVLATGAFTTASVNLNTDEHLFGFDSDFSSSLASSGNGDKIVQINVLSTDLTNVDLEAARAFNLTSADIAEVYPELTTVNKATNTISFVVREQNDIDAATALDLAFTTQPKDNARGDFEDVPASSIQIPEVDIDLVSEPIVAKTRKLKAKWTPEFAQDLNAYQNVDAEAELTNLLSEFISMEIDLEILDMLIVNAATTERWSAQNNKIWQGTKEGGSFTTATSDFFNTQGQWFQTLGTKIQKVSNKIHQKTLRGGANFLVVSPTVSTILESIPGYAANTDGDKMDYAFGVQKVGQLNGRYKVYKNPYFTENIILMGYRGSQFLETGAVYSPYIPLMMTPLVYEPETFTPRKGVMTRYAKKMIRPEFYGKIYVSDLSTI